MNTRFAPSPSGYLHLGNVRTALFNALLAYQNQGNFLLRIEDTDPLRSSFKFIKAIQDDLAWLGLFKTEDYATKLSFQSKRYTIYQDYYQVLAAKELVYPCFCTHQRLEDLRASQVAKRLPPGYDGHCRQLSLTAIKDFKAKEQPAALRFKVEKGKTITFEDSVKGLQQVKSDHLTDFIIQYSDGHPAFLYCNALDDALMQITHVLRGEDHLTNAAKQCLLLEALGFSIPVYGHLPLICHQTSMTPLSKRDNSFSVASLRAQGYLPNAILNYLARLGHTIDSEALMSLERLGEAFALSNTHTSAAHFDQAQLNFWQKQAIRTQHAEEFWNLLSSAAKAKVPYQTRAHFLEVIQPMVVFPQEAEEWIDQLFEKTPYTDESIDAIRQVNAEFWMQLLILFKETSDEASLVKGIKNYFRAALKREQRNQWKALRAALTNRLSGPDILSVISLIKVPRAIEKLEAALLFATQ